MSNAVKSGATNKGTVKGIHFTFPCLPAIPLLAGAGADFIYLDGEHGCFNWSDIELACIAAERCKLTVIARVPDIKTSTITRFLDRGVKGIVAPHIETVQEALQVIQATYFAPMGERSFGGVRWQPDSNANNHASYLAACNDDISVCMMIESKRGLENAAAIAQLEGVHYLSFGVNDLAQSLGHHDDPSHPIVQKHIADCSDQIRATGKAVREDFIKFAWINDVLSSGYQTLLGTNETT
ncbi:HpcH/HpaI aldolase family protein [Advenella kashmirensis]